jgi:hypothetical protein
MRLLLSTSSSAIRSIAIRIGEHSTEKTRCTTIVPRRIFIREGDYC